MQCAPDSLVAAERSAAARSHATYLLWGLMKGIEVVGHGVSPDTTFIALVADTSKAKIDCRSAVVWAKFAVRRQPPAIPTKFSRLPQKVPPQGHRIDG